MAERYEDSESFEFYIGVLRADKLFSRWFRIASGNLDHFDASDDMVRYESDETERYLALCWQQFESTVLCDEPRNELVRQSLVASDTRVREALKCDAVPWELLKNDDDSL
jgi:hypothetical protein